MSNNLNFKQVAGATRRKWDVETYAKRAQSRQEALEQGEDLAAAAAGSSRGASKNKKDDDDDDREEFRPAIQGAARPEGSDKAFLKARSGGVMKEMESQVGQSTFVDTSGGGGGSTNKADGVTATGVGWHCKVCDCFLKDSLTYLDHINGRKHQRALGYSMHVQRSTQDDVRSKLQALKQKKKQQQQSAEDEQEMDFHAKVEQKDEELRQRKEERRQRRKERKQKAKQQQQQEEQEEVPPPQPKEEQGEANPADDGDKEERVQGKEEEDVDEGDADIDPALAAMMGFSGFGTTKS